MVLNFVTGGIKQSVYRAASAAKIGWFTSQYVGVRHVAGPVVAPGEVPKPYNGPRITDRSMAAAFFAAFRAEREDIAKGVYKLPREYRIPPSPLRSLLQARQNLHDARKIAKRRFTPGGGVEVRDIAPDSYPTYYRQNFHFQTDGWMTDQSADIYDTQVEALFTGAASTMRRRALPMILKGIKDARGRGATNPVVVDLACGTGELLVDLLDNDSEADFTAIDLSPAYLGKAKKKVSAAMGAKAPVKFLQGNAEAIPLADNSVDVLYTVYLFHELPPKVRRTVAAEMARVLKPGGTYVHVDSVQYGDTDLDVLLEGFPRAVHEPYYDSYCNEDFDAIFEAEGFKPLGKELAFLTKAVGYQLKA